jgi:hypothetical protein
MQVAPVEVEPVRVGVQLDGDPVGRRLFEHGVEVDRVRLARQQQAARGVGENREVRIVESTQRAAGHRLAVHGKARVNGADDEVEVVQQLVAVVDLSVGENVGLDALKDSEILHGRIELVDLVVLGANLVVGQPTGVERGLGVVGDADVAPSARLRRARHVRDRRLAVGVE